MIVTQQRKGDYDISLFHRIKSKYRRLCFRRSLSNRCSYLFCVWRSAVTMLILLACMPATLWAQTGLHRLDEWILEDLQATRTDGQTRLWRFVSDANNYVNAAIPVGVLVDGLIRNDDRTKRNGLYMATSTATTYLLNLAIKQLVKRPRPFLTDLRLTPVYRPGEYSFPSGHTSSAFSAMTSLSRCYPKWYVIAPSFVWAAGVGYSRTYLGVHYPTDVTAGAVLGTGTAFAMGFLRP
jgi:membrane-associated phospholipid phosphatase